MPPGEDACPDCGADLGDDAVIEVDATPIPHDQGGITIQDAPQAPREEQAIHVRRLEVSQYGGGGCCFSGCLLVVFFLYLAFRGFVSLF